MKNIIFILLFILVCQSGLAQSWSHNFVRERKPQTRINNTASLESKSNFKDSVSTDIQYFDGMDRPKQKVSMFASPSGKDIIIPIKYDAIGREAKNYLPYASITANNGAYASDDEAEQTAFYTSGSPKCIIDTRAYSETVFEPSPLNRPTKNFGPGQSWYDNVRSMGIDYQSNTYNEVHLWTINGSTVSTSDDYYPGLLFKDQITDENGNKIWEFKDRQGRVILERTEGENNTLLSTYNVYDDLGRLVYVIPPKATANSYTENTPDFNELVYAYHYDGRERLIEKHIPGSGWWYMVYNKLDQLILNQDANQREGTGTITANTWSFRKYDALGRMIMTGTVNIPNSRSTIQSTVNNETTLWETSNSTLTGSFCYTGSSYPQSTFSNYEVRIVNYYDSYDFDRDGKNFQAAQGYTAESIMTKGLLTGSKVKVLDGNNTWLTTINYYDDKGRPIQVYSKKYSLNNDIWDRITISYDFTDKIIKTERLHNNITILNRYVYDHAGRRKEVYQIINSEPEVELAEYNYNELGQLVKKNLHGNNSSRLQGIDYRFNIRGWLTSINNARLDTDQNNDDSDDAFGEELTYNSNFTAGTAQESAQFNGNITGMTWKTKGPSIPYSNVNVSAYAFKYDKLNQLKRANYGSGANGSSWSDQDGFYNEECEYDVMGNIQSLSRKNMGNLMDNLTYSYKNSGNSNTLLSVTDNTSDVTGFNDGNKSGDDYLYDSNGNLTKDNNKGLDITYNYLNQPASVSKSSETINFIYDATGKKVAKKFTGEPNHYYMDGIEYSGNTLLFAMTEEGRVRPGSSGNYTYDYFLKDHLGNVRVVLSSETPLANVYPVATMEDGNASVENLYYANIDNTRDVKPSGFDDNPVNQEVARLTSSESTRQKGPSITLKVNTGDKINLSVNSFYHSGADCNRYALGETALSQLLSALLSPMALSGVAQATATDAFNNQAFGNSSNFQNMVGALPNSNYNSSPSNTPKAYLVWMLFDNEFKLIKTGNSSGMIQVPTGADQRNTMAQTDITMDKSGFFYAYVVNESPTNVYFDDFQVSLTSGLVLEENNYFPFGMLNAQLSAPGITDPLNNYKYNGKELQKELSLEWLNYGARFYDPQIGRWHSPDLMSEYFNDQSPYDYVANNPVSFIDPDGNFATRNDAENYQDIHGIQGDVLRNIWGDYFISERGYYSGEGVGVRQNLYYGLSGHNNVMGPYGGPLQNRFPSGSGGRGGSIQGLTYNRGISLSLAAISVHTGTIETGFKTAKLLQQDVAIFAKGAKVLGTASNVLGFASIGYDIATGQVKGSTVGNAIVLGGGIIIGAAIGITAAPYIAAVGVIYGIASVAGLDKYLDNNIPIPRSINIFKEGK